MNRGHISEKSAVLEELCGALSRGASGEALDILRRGYPFAPNPVMGRRYSPLQSTRVFVRDGFIDRYSGERLVYLPVLRVISAILPEGFPYHPNWKTDVTHPAYWDLSATVDHLVPVSRGGADDESNWVTTSMARNSAKGNWLLEDLGWGLRPAGDFDAWDGLLKWFVQYTEERGEALAGNSLKQWRRAARAVLAERVKQPDSR